MEAHQAQPGSLLSYLVPAAVFALLFLFRARSMSRERPLKLERLWVFPAFYLVITIVVLVQLPPTPVGWAACIGALLVGAGLGWYRGKTMRITVDPDTHQLNQKASLAGILFIMVIILVRSAARMEGAAMHLNVTMLTDALLFLALGLFSATRLEMYLRGRRLLAEARTRRR